MELRDVDLRSVGPSVQKLWPTTFFAKKMPCILHCNAKKISNTISSQVSGRAQLPGVIKYIVDQESNTAKSGGHTCALWTHPSAQSTKEIVQNLTEYTQLTKNVYFLDLMILYYL